MIIQTAGAHRRAYAPPRAFPAGQLSWREDHSDGRALAPYLRSRSRLPQRLATGQLRAHGSCRSSRHPDLLDAVGVRPPSRVIYTSCGIRPAYLCVYPPPLFRYPAWPPDIYAPGIRAVWAAILLPTFNTSACLPRHSLHAGGRSTVQHPPRARGVCRYEEVAARQYLGVGIALSRPLDGLRAVDNGATELRLTLRRAPPASSPAPSLGP
ncbi:hypothetical protein DFH09DRAFT_401821 [Mycena vulgaris]|nr:hypothetical protein DFH09DRAFT_401821 [Mycena vulgaris]